MPSNNRSDNQYFGKYRECCIVAHLNNSAVEFHENFEFTEKEKQQLFDETKKVATFIGEHTATYIGNHTGTEAGDILLDNGETIEIKSVSSGNGTYFNTSIYYFEKFGFNFKDYMKRYGLISTLQKHFGTIVRVSDTNNSPVSQANSSLIRHQHNEIYEKNILPVEATMRKAFITDIANYFILHPDKIYEFISDMLNKNTSSSKKTAPNRLIVFNYAKSTVREINLSTFSQNINTNIRITPKGLVIGNLRIAISWQNGVGLNNPTIRIFLLEE